MVFNSFEKGLTKNMVENSILIATINMGEYSRKTKAAISAARHFAKPSEPLGSLSSVALSYPLVKALIVYYLNLVFARILFQMSTVRGTLQVIIWHFFQKDQQDELINSEKLAKNF